MDAQTSDTQPGDPEQLARCVEAAERYYEGSRHTPVIVYWDETVKKYRIGYEDEYEPDHHIEVVRIP